MEFVKFILDLGPLAAFFIGYYKFGGIFAATKALVIVTPLVLVIYWLIFKKIPVMHIVTLIFVLIFGGLTLYFQDETFIKIKVTIINLIFASALFGGVMTGRPLIKYMLGEKLKLTDEGWRKMTLYWAFFFTAMALTNEIIWRNFSNEVWVSFKAWGILGLTLLFTFIQIYAIKDYLIDPEAE